MYLNYSMRHILQAQPKNIKIGINNYISPSAIIHENVIIGNNNKIYDNVIIYPNTIIGNNNIILNNNIIGEYPISTNSNYKDYNFNKCKNVIINDNNFFHVRNIIFAGIDRNTLINNNNKILGEIHIGHDCILENNITLYPRIIIAGYVNILNNANIGMCASIQQRTIIGQSCMVGGNIMTTKNVFPYFININNKITRLNKIKILPIICEYEKELLQLYDDFKIKKYNLDSYNIPNVIKDDLTYFYSKINQFNVPSM